MDKQQLQERRLSLLEAICQAADEIKTIDNELRKQPWMQTIGTRVIDWSMISKSWNKWTRLISIDIVEAAPEETMSKKGKSRKT